MRNIDDTIKTNVILDYICNNNCKFCFVGNKKNERVNTTSEVEKIIIDARKQGSTQLHFLGGEPTLRKDLCYLITFAKKLGYSKIAITTNGRALSYDSISQKLIDAGLNNIIFSIHGSNSKIHDSLTQVPGSFNQLMKGIKNCQNKNVFLEGNVCINKQNQADIENIAKLVIREKIKSVEMMLVDPRGSAENNFDFLEPVILIVSKNIKKAISLSLNTKTEILSRYIPFCFLDSFYKFRSENFETETTMSIAPDFNDPDSYNSTKDFATYKPEICKNCIFDNFCFGFHNGHKDFFKYIKPILGKKYTSREDFLNG
jgi:MoaA/NifB/PqqE/SkfB family radical SAM enzyme